MLTTFSPRRGYRRLAVAASLSMAAAVFLSASIAIASHTTESGPGDSEVDLSGPALDEATPAELRALVGDLAVERDELVRSLAHLQDLYDPLEADRQLLFELRKGLPDTRPEAEAQLARLRSLALSSDPARLGQLIDRVGETAPAFLEWRFSEFDSTEQATVAYIDSGANAFDSSMDEFRKEVLMSVANRLDGLLTVIDRVR